MRICLISEEFPPETGWGGIGTYSYNLARGLVALGHRVHVIARCWGDDRIDDVEGVRVHRLAVPEPSWRTGTWWINMRFPESRAVVMWNRRVAECVRTLRDRERIDLVETPEFHAQGLMTAWREPDVPMIVRLHTPAFLCRELNGAGAGGSESDTWLSEQLEYRLARRAKVITSPSRAMAQDVARVWKLDSSQIRVIANPIDDERFAEPPGNVRDENEILFVGRLERRKGVHTIADALPAVLREFPRAKVKLVGSDHPSGLGGMSMNAHLRAMLREAGVAAEAMEFVGAVERTELPKHYHRAAMCLVPSLYESFGYTCVEAMAAGCPVVAAEAGALPEIVTDRTDGLLVPPEDPAALANAIATLLRNASMRKQLAANAQRTVAQRFSNDAVCREMAKLYQAVLV